MRWTPGPEEDHVVREEKDEKEKGQRRERRERGTGLVSDPFFVFLINELIFHS